MSKQNKENPIGEASKIKKIEVPEPKLMDVMREIKTLRADFGVLSQAVKALGKDVLAKNERAEAVYGDMVAKISNLQDAFIKTVSGVSAGTQYSHTVATKQPQNMISGLKTQEQANELAKKVEQGQFDPADLMQHQWKRGKKKPDGTYDRGSLSYGWDFKKNFKPETVAVLPLTIAGYDFTMNGDFVNTKKAKK